MYVCAMLVFSDVEPLSPSWTSGKRSVSSVEAFDRYSEVKHRKRLAMLLRPSLDDDLYARVKCF